MPFNRDRYRGGHFPFFIIFTLLKAFILGGIVMLLWNYVLPAVTGLKLISYWQAVGLWLLCRILFGGLGHGNGMSNPSSPWKVREWKNKWMQMTPEEREKFKQEWRNRCRKKE